MDRPLSRGLPLARAAARRRVDDRRSHDGDVAFGDDRLRDRTLLAAGYAVMRFTVVELLSRPAVVAADLRAAIERRRAALTR